MGFVERPATTRASCPWLTKVNLQLDRHTRAPHTDESSVGVDREIGRHLAVAAPTSARTAGISSAGPISAESTWKRPTCLMGARAGVSAHQFDSQPAVSADESGALFPDLPRPRDRAGKTAVPRMAGVRLLHALERVRAAGVQRDHRRRGPNEHRRPAESIVFGRDPNDFANAIGRLPDDRPHIFRVMGSVDVPRTGLVLAANLQHFSGKPWAATPDPIATAHQAMHASCSSHAGHAGCRRKRFSTCGCRARSPSAPRTTRAAGGRAQRPQRLGGRSARFRKHLQFQFCCPQHLRGSPPGDGRPQSEPRSLTSHAGIKGRMHPFVIRDFQPGASVRLGDTAVSSWVRDSTTISISGTAAHAAGTVDVIVTNPGGPEARLTVRRPISVEVEGF